MRRKSGHPLMALVLLSLLFACLLVVTGNTFVVAATAFGLGALLSIAVGGSRHP